MKSTQLSRLSGWTLITVLFFTMSALSGGSLLAETKVDFSGQVRYRAEFDRRNFSSLFKIEKYSLLRTRFNIATEVDENAHLFIQFQDSRTLGDTTFTGAKQSGGLNDGKNVDLHQAYLKLDNVFGVGWGAQLGRFEVNFGNQRAFGAVGWHNVGRSWEGVNSWYDNPSLKISGWALKAVEVKNLTGNRDFDLFGFSADIRSARVSLFAILERNAKRDAFGKKTLNRFNLGGFVKHTSNRFDFEGNAVYQGGTISTAFAAGTKNIVGATIAQTPITAEQTLDIQAYMVAGEIGYNLPGGNKVRVALGADISSGDADATDTDFKSYNNLYYTGHKFRGYMDYFLGSNFGGLIDLMFRGKIEPTQGWIVKGDVHYFQTVEDYLDFNSTLTTDVGIEVDLSVTTTRVRGARIVSGVSVFLPEDSFAGSTTNDPGLWGYSQVIVGF